MNRILPGHWNAYFLIIVTSVVMMALVANLPFRIKPFGDHTFHEESRDLALFFKGGLEASAVRITKAPGPILFYTPAYLLAPKGSSDDVLWGYGVFMTTLLLTVSLLLLYRSAVALFSRRVALLTILLFLIFPIHFYYSLGIVGEVPAFFSLSLALFGWSRCLENPGRIRGYVLIGLGLLLLILNRPNAMLVLLAIPVALVFAYLKAKPFFYRHARRLTIVFFLVLVAGIGCLRAAKAITGNLQKNSQETLLYYVMHEGRFQFREEPFDWRFWDGDNRPDSKDHHNWKKSHNELHIEMARTQREYKDVYREWLIADAIENPWYFTRQFFIKAFYGHIYIINSITPQKFALGPFNGPAAYYGLHVLINLVNLAILAGLTIFLLREKNQLRVWLFWGIILSLIAFHAFTYMEPRYLFPSKAALYILAAAGLLRIGLVSRLLVRIENLIYPEIKPSWKVQSR